MTFGGFFAIVISYLILINLHFDTKIIAVNYRAAMLLIKKKRKKWTKYLGIPLPLPTPPVVKKHVKM